TLVLKTGMPKSIHNVECSSSKGTSGGRPGKVKRKNQKAAAKKAAYGNADEDDEK
ncbi:hypothetical protein Tco_1473395, partial [Tanacetum coccineum]